MFGGADPSIPDLVPRTSRSAEPLSEPLAWKAGEPGYEESRGGEEPARAQERAPCGHRGQPPRGHLAPGAERIRRALHASEPGRRGAVVDRPGRHVRQQHRPLRGPRDQHPRAGQRQRRRPKSASDARTNRQQRVPGRRHDPLSDPRRRDHVPSSTIPRCTGASSRCEGRPPSTGSSSRNIVPHNAYGIIGTNIRVGRSDEHLLYRVQVFTNNAIAGPWPTSGGATTSMYSRTSSPPHWTQ